MTTKLDKVKNRFPIFGTENVLAVSVLPDLEKGQWTGIIFPEWSGIVNSPAYDLLNSAITYKTGNPFIQVHLVTNKTTDSTITGVDRNSASLDINARMIMETSRYQVALPDDIKDKISQYTDLYDKGVSTGLSDEELESYKTILRSLKRYFLKP